MHEYQLPHADWALVANRLHMVLSQALSDEDLDELLSAENEPELVAPARAA